MTNEHKEPWTQEPWYVSTSNDGSAIVIESAQGAVAEIVCDHEGGPQHANARLIVEAPEMAKLLKALVVARDIEIVFTLQSNAEVLLSRARGEGK